MELNGNLPRRSLQFRHLSREELDSLVAVLEQEYEKMKEKLLYQELLVQRTKDAIEDRRKSIQSIRERSASHGHTDRTALDIIEELKKEVQKSEIQRQDNIISLLDELSAILKSAGHLG